MTILRNVCMILQCASYGGEAVARGATMRNMTSVKREQQAQRMQADLKELAERIADALPRDGKIEPRPGLVLTRLSAPTEPVHAVLEPWFCMIAQGTKDVLLGDEWFHYDPAHYLISTLGL